MPHKVIYSRFFLERVYSWSQALQDMAFKAAEHAAIDPNHTDYSRAYLTPYKQKHPTTDHQYTLYFEIITTSTSVYFSWINDHTCLHTTRANYDDPCLKEFNRLRNLGRLETYDQKFHHIQFEVQPDHKKPFRCRSRYLGHEVQANTSKDASGTFLAHSFNSTETHPDIAKIHIVLFLNELHNHISQNSVPFEFCIYKTGNHVQIDQLTKYHDATKWNIIHDPDDFIMRPI